MSRSVRNCVSLSCLESLSLPTIHAYCCTNTNKDDYSAGNEYEARPVETIIIYLHFVNRSAFQSIHVQAKLDSSCLVFERCDEVLKEEAAENDRLLVFSVPDEDIAFRRTVGFSIGFRRNSVQCFI